MNERVSLPTPRIQEQVSLNARINYKAERPNPITSIPLFAQERRYQEAARSVIETSQQDVTIYQPYIHIVEGKEPELGGEKPHRDIASRYASVKVGEKETWFEITGQQDRSQVTSVDFITADPLQIILGDKNNKDVQKLHGYTDEPHADKAIIRFVGIHEIPLYTGVERTVDPAEIQQAAISLTQQLLTKEGQPTQVPTVEDIGEFVERQQQFEHLITASNGVEIGKPQHMEVMLDNSHARLLYLYPTISPDGEQATIISNKELHASEELAEGEERTVIGRMDFYCSCQKHGERAQGHGCGRELLGALKAVISPEDSTPKNDKTIIVAWGGVDDLGNGSVLHSLKTPNSEKLGLLSIPDTQADTGKPTYLRRSREVFSRVPLVERRNFDSMAAVMFAGVELSGAIRLDFFTTNKEKKEAVIGTRDEMFLNGSRYVEIDANEQAHLAVPPEVRARDLADRHPTRRGAIPA